MSAPGGRGSPADDERTPLGRDLESQLLYAVLISALVHDDDDHSDGDNSDSSSPESDSGRSDSSWSSLDSDDSDADSPPHAPVAAPQLQSDSNAVPLVDLRELNRAEERQRQERAHRPRPYSFGISPDRVVAQPAAFTGPASARAALPAGQGAARGAPAVNPAPAAGSQPPAVLQPTPRRAAGSARRCCPDWLCHCPAYHSRDEVSWHCSFGFLTLAMTCISVVFGWRSLHTPSRGVGFHMYSGAAVLGVLLTVASWCIGRKSRRSPGSWWCWWQMLLIPPLALALAAWTAYGWVTYPKTDDGALQPDVVFSFCMALWYASMTVFVAKSCLAGQLCDWDAWYMDSDRCCCFISY